MKVTTSSGMGSMQITDNAILRNQKCGVRADAGAQVSGSGNYIAGNREGDLCPPDFPWPPGFRK